MDTLVSDFSVPLPSRPILTSLKDIDLAVWIPFLLGLWLLDQVLRTIYSVYFGPLSKIPGPKLAAATYWYEIYYDAYKPGLYWREIKAMHEHYGPIVRVNPSEVHVNDPKFYNKLYNNTGKWDKDIRSARQFFGMGSIASTVVHEVHKGRRSVLDSFFSRTNIENFEQNIKWHVEKLCRRLREFQEQERPVPLNLAFASVSADVVTNYLMPQPYWLLDTPGFSPSFYDMMRAASQYSQIAKNFAWGYPALEYIPRWLGRWLSPIGIQNLEDQDFVESIIAKYAANPEEYDQPTRYIEGLSVEKLKPSADMQPPLKNGFLVGHVLNNPLPGGPSEKSFKRLAQEFQILIGAASDETGLVISHVLYYSLNNPNIISRIKAELKQAGIHGDVIPGVRELEKLPYLSAVVSEALRITIPIAARLTRVAPDRALIYEQYVIPAGTTVAMNMADLHLNEDLFPDPYTFNPERWLGPDALANKRNYVPFSRGTRNCVGRYLATAQILLVSTAMFTRFNMELFETTIDDVSFQHDFFAPQAKLGSKGVRVKIL